MSAPAANSADIGPKISLEIAVIIRVIPQLALVQEPQYHLAINLAHYGIAVMFNEIRSRLPYLHITGKPAHLGSNFINGINRMPFQIYWSAVTRKFTWDVA